MRAHTATGRWWICLREGQWRVYDPQGCWHDRAESLSEAHDEAARCALFAALSAPGGLACLTTMLRRSEILETSMRQETGAEFAYGWRCPRCARGMEADHGPYCNITPPVNYYRYVTDWISND